MLEMHVALVRHGAMVAGLATLCVEPSLHLKVAAHLVLAYTLTLIRAWGDGWGKQCTKKKAHLSSSRAVDTSCATFMADGCCLLHLPDGHSYQQRGQLKHLSRPQTQCCVLQAETFPSRQVTP